MTTALFVAGLCSKNRFYFKVMSSFILFINKRERQSNNSLKALYYKVFRF
jgi:hypothetical protein